MKGLLAKAAIAGVGTLLVGAFALAAVGNDHTGFDSENNANIDQVNTAKIIANNNTDLENSVDGTLDSGGNHASYNTGSGSATSGDASADVSATNKVNEAKASLALSGMFMGTLDVTNSTTGADSENNAWIKTKNELTITTNNNANVENEVTVSANTGDNISSYNTGNGSVSSGDAMLKVNLSNTLNSSDVSTH